MADGIVIRTNIPDFRRQLAALSKRMESKVVTSAARAAGAVFRTYARSAAPVLKARTARRTAGALKRGIYVGRSRDSRKGKVVMFVGVKSGGRKSKGSADPFYWRFLEGGWMPRGRASALRGGRRTKALQRRRLLAAGARRVTHPFLAPAFERGQVRALAAFVDKMNQGLAAVARNER